MAIYSAQRLQGGRRIRGYTRSREPLVSIISVVFRAASGLEPILNNVASLGSDDIELIVIDGGSNDGTVELLRSWDHMIEYWMSEPDRGIYDAMNKAHTFARGHFLYHLNVGDRLLRFPKERLERARRDRLDAVSFAVSIDGIRESRPSYGFLLRLKNTMHHQGTFYRRTGFPRYDTRFPMYADFDANQRLLLAGAKVEVFDEVVAWHASGGVGDQTLGYEESSAILRKNFGRIYVVLAIVMSEWKGIRMRRKAALKRWLARHFLRLTRAIRSSGNAG